MNTKQKPYQLTFDDAVYVWLRHWSGEYQHRIAAAYDVNPGRVRLGINTTTEKKNTAR